MLAAVNLKQETLSTSPPFLPEVFSLADIEREMVVLAPCSQDADLVSVGGLFAVGDGGVVCKLHDDVRAARSHTVVHEQGAQEESTQA